MRRPWPRSGVAHNGAVAHLRDAAPSSAARPGLTWLGAFIAGGVALSGVYTTTGWGVPCPFLMLTGWECPFCGGTRLGAALLQAQPAVALAANPAVFVGLSLLAVLAVVWVIEVLGGPAVRLRPGVRRALARFGPWPALALALLAAATYTVGRHLL